MKPHSLTMEIRSVDEAGRTIEGICAPYDEISYLAGDNPNGERVRKGAFNKSIQQRGDRILLFRQHDYDAAVGKAVELRDSNEGLLGRFRVAQTAVGDATLHEVNEGVLPGLSVGFRPIQTRAAENGVVEILEAALLEVSLVTIAAYDSAGVLAVREASMTSSSVREILAKLGNAPDVDLSPLAPLW